MRIHAHRYKGTDHLDNQGFIHIGKRQLLESTDDFTNWRRRLKEVNRRQPGRVRLLQGSLVYRDQRLQGFDAGTLVEVIEHMDPPRLATMERVVFEFAAPKLTDLGPAVPLHGAPSQMAVFER